VYQDFDDDCTGVRPGLPACRLSAAFTTTREDGRQVRCTSGLAAPGRTWFMMPIASMMAIAKPFPLGVDLLLSRKL
jgi:hypothetical protein